VSQSITKPKRGNRRAKKKNANPGTRKRGPTQPTRDPGGSCAWSIPAKIGAREADIGRRALKGKKEKDSQIRWEEKRKRKLKPGTRIRGVTRKRQRANSPPGEGEKRTPVLGWAKRRPRRNPILLCWPTLVKKRPGGAKGGKEIRLKTF